MSGSSHVKQTLDDLKSGLLNYYSRLYNTTDPNIDRRLQQLQTHFVPTPSVNSIYKNQIGENANRTDGSAREIGGRQDKNPSSILENLPPPDSLTDPMAEGRMAQQRKAMITTGGDIRSSDQMNLYGIMQRPGTKATSEMKGRENVLGRDLRDTQQGEIYQVLSDLQHKCQAADARLAGLSDDCWEETGDPTLREWDFQTFPHMRRRPVFGNNEELRRHMMNLYASLNFQTQHNQKRINGLRTKIKILDMHTKSNMVKLKDDPRIAF